MGEFGYFGERVCVRERMRESRRYQWTGCLQVTSGEGKRPNSGAFVGKLGGEGVLCEG